MLTNANTKAAADLTLPFLSVKQPWAWLLAHGWKNIENRSWKTEVRGRFLIHAAKTMTRGDYQACVLFVAGFSPSLALKMPGFGSFERGGIVGEAVILDCVDHHGSEWFCGPHGFVIGEARPLPFYPCAGKLGFFKLAGGTDHDRG